MERDVAETTLLKIVALAGQFSVRSDKEGVLQIEGMKNQSGELQRWREIAPLVYREIGGFERLGFRRDASGAIAEILPFPAIYEGQRVQWYASKIFIGLLIGGSLLLALLTVLLWPVAVIIRKRYQRPLFSTKVIAFYIFSHELFASPKWFSFSRQSLRLARDWSTS